MNTQIPANWRYFETTPSTNDTLHEAAASGAPEGTVHFAGSQTQGRGRVGRSWWSPAGSGLWMSVLLRPSMPVHETAGISLIAGRALKLSLRHRIERPIDLHWPNDLYVGEKKLAGILGELRSREERFWIVLGVGVNLDLRRAEVPPFLRDKVICLAGAGCRAPEAIPLMHGFLEAFWPLYRRFQAGEGAGGIVGADLAHLGKRVRIRPVPDSESGAWQGVIAGIGEAGELLVGDAAGAIHKVTAGEVIYED